MRLGKLSLLHSFSSFISKIFGTLRDIFLASFFGAGLNSDMFLIALKLPISFKRSISDETFNSAYIPLFGKYKDLSDKDKEYQFARKILVVTSLIFIPLIIIFEIFMPSIVNIFASSIINEDDFEILVKSSRIIFPYLAFITISSVFVGTLNANNKFSLGALLPVFLNLSIILFIVLFPVFGQVKIIFLSWSVLFGGIIQSLFLFFAVDKAFWRVFFTVNNNYFSTKEFFKLILPTFLSSTVLQLNTIIVLLIASQESGAVSYLHYAERLFFIPLTLIAISIGTVLIPNLSKAFRESNSFLANNLQLEAFRYCLVLVLPITFCLIVLSNDIVQFLFERGEFTHEATLSVGLASKYFLVGLPFGALVKILTPYFFAIERPKIPLKISLFTVAINLTFVTLLFKHLGFIGIPIGFSISAVFNLILILIQHRKLNFFILDKNMIIYICKYLILSIILSLILLVLDFFQITTYILFLDLLMKILLVSFLWAGTIYLFDKDVINFFKK